MSNHPLVKNKRTEEYDVDICRPTIYGNPFRMFRESDRWGVLAEFEVYANHRFETDLVWRKAVENLKGLRLGCVCNPKACHGNTLARLANPEIILEEAVLLPLWCV